MVILLASLTHAVQIPFYLLLRVYLLLAPVASLSPIGEPDDSTYAAALLTRTQPYDYCIIRIGRNLTLKGEKKAEGSHFPGACMTDGIHLGRDLQSRITICRRSCTIHLSFVRRR